MLATILLANEGLHVQAIADRTGLPYSVTQREVERLEKAGLVSSKRFGTARVVRADERHPLFPELRALLLKAYGPHELLERLLANEAGVDEAYVYGSWAARYHGVWGPPYADVDVLLIGNPSVSRVEELEAEAEDALGQPVEIVAVPQADWDRGSSAFLRTIKDRPLVPLELKTRK